MIRHAEDNWLEWSIVSPTLRDVPVILNRNGWERKLIASADELSPEMNVSGLFWMPTGIYRETQQAMPQEVHQQMNSLNNSSWANMIGWSSQFGGTK